MSIKSEIDRIKAAIAAAYQAVGNKGGTIPSAENAANLAQAIGSIQTGITPTGTKSITANGTHDVTNYASANVNVPIPSGYVDLSTLNLHCTQYNSDEFASKGSRIDSVSITVGFQPKIFLVRNNAAVRGTSSTANKYWMLSSLMVYDDAGHVHHRTSFVYYSGSSSSYKYAGGQSNTNYFEPTATGVQGVGTVVYMNDNETGLYSWYAWG